MGRARRAQLESQDRAPRTHLFSRSSPTRDVGSSDFPLGGFVQVHLVAGWGPRGLGWGSPGFDFGGSQEYRWFGPCAAPARGMVRLTEEQVPAQPQGC